MSTPTHMELFRATVEHEPHDQFLFRTGYTRDLQERMLVHFGASDIEEVHDRFGMISGVTVGIPERTDRPAPDFSRYYEDIQIPENSSINSFGVLLVGTDFYHFTHRVSPLRNATTLAEVEDFPFPTPERYNLDPARLEAVVRRAHEEGKAVTGSIGHMYETSWQVRGYEEFLVDMYENPEICHLILERLSERNLAMAEAYATAGVDILHTGDDVANQNAMMFSVDMWRKFMKHRWAKVFARAREINPRIEIFYHSDGNIMDIIPELIEIGVTVLNPVQPECLDVAEVKQRFGKKLVLDGTIGTQTTMPFGSPEEVKAVVRDRKKNLGYDGALVLAPTHVLEPEVPIENVVAFFEASGELM